MKQFRFPTSVLRLAICVLLIASAQQSVGAREYSSTPSGAIFATSATEGGRSIIRRSPVLGSNVRISLKIDGKVAGPVMWGRTYDRYITPGRHILTATPNRLGGVWQVMLDMRPGQTYSYMASYNVSKLVLTPTSGPR